MNINEILTQAKINGTWGAQTAIDGNYRYGTTLMQANVYGDNTTSTSQAVCPRTPQSRSKLR